MGEWTPEFESFRDFEGEIYLKDENNQPINLTGWFAKFQVTYDGGEIVWSTASGHLTTPALGVLAYKVTKAEILALPAFKWATFEFFAGANANNLDLLYVTKARRV